MTRLICPEDIDGIETPFAREMARPRPARPLSHPVATETSRSAGSRWRTVTDTDQRGGRLPGVDPMRICPSCWPHHPRQANERTRVHTDEPMEPGEIIRCSWCDKRRVS